MRFRSPRVLALCVAACVVALTGCSSDDGSTGDPVAGKRLFVSKGCGGCHTFSAAAATGTSGPDLDKVAPSSGRVMRQLRYGGGLMPRFADKLSDTEMRAIAAFVGGSRGSGKAVAKPFTPDKVRLADCTTGTPDCLEQAFANMVFNVGPKPALARLAAMQSTNQAVAGDCHRIAHRMGSAALARFHDEVAQAFIQGTAVCASGYYHGIVERAFLGQPNSRLAKVADQMCSDARINRTPFLAYQCLHGLGHGLMIYTGYDMPLSLRTCDHLKDDFAQTSCTGGVFMENFNTSYGVKSRYVHADDPIYPCNIVVEKHKYNCYLLVTANLLRVNQYDQAKTAAGCRRSEPAWVKTCFESFGRDVSGIAGKDPQTALASCRLATDHERDCIYGVAREIVNADAGGRRAGRFCSLASKASRERCYDGVGSVLAALTPQPDQLSAACAAVTRRYAAACRRGGGLAQ